MIWKTNNYYVDIETGEQINRNLIKLKEYIIIKTIKTTQHYDTYTIIERTIECRRNQNRIEFTNNQL